MNAIESAVKEAVEKGGYIHPGNQHIEFPCNEITFLDPAFWSALGKARRKEDVWLMYKDGHWQVTDGSAQFRSDTAFSFAWWHYQMRSLTDHLASGGTSEDFFKEL